MKWVGISGGAKLVNLSVATSLCVERVESQGAIRWVVSAKYSGPGGESTVPLRHCPTELEARDTLREVASNLDVVRIFPVQEPLA